MSTLASALLALRIAAAPGQVTPQEVSEVLNHVAEGSRPDVEQAINRIQFLGTPKPIVHGLIKMALGELAGSQENAIYVLSIVHPAEAGPAFAALLGSESGPIRVASCQGLAKLKGDKATSAKVAARLEDKVSAVRRECAHALGAWDGGGQGAELAKVVAREQDPDARLAELEALGRVKSPASVKALEPFLKSQSREEHQVAAQALAQQSAPSGKKALEDDLAAIDPSVRAQAVDLIATVNAPWATDDLAKRLDDPSADVCIRAAKALNARKDKRGVEALILRAERASPDDKFAFEGALSELKVTQAQRLDVIHKSGGGK